MNGRIVLLSTVESALSTTPSVICNLIVQYVYRPPNRWNPVAVGTVSTHQVDNRSEFESDLIDHVDRSRMSYRIVVIAAAVRESVLDWTMVVDYDSCFSIGVTTTTENCVDPELLFDTYRPRTWTIGTVLNLIRFYEDGWIRKEFRRTNDSNRLSFRFAANPETRQITVRSDAIENGRSEVVLATAGTDDEFWSLRPCAILSAIAGRQTVRLISESEGNRQSNNRL